MTSPGVSAGVPSRVVALACDYLDAPAPAAAFTAAGYVAVLRYLRNLTQADVAEAHAAGLGVGTIFETLADEALQGNAKGHVDGAAAAAGARTLGQPDGTLLVVNLGDFKPTPAQVPAIHSYFAGFDAEVPDFAICAYATSYLIGQLAALGAHPIWWQNAMDDQGVRGNVVHPTASLYQRVTPTAHVSAPGGSWDEDVILKPIPWWTAARAPSAPPSPRPAPAPAPAPSIQEFTVRSPLLTKTNPGPRVVSGAVRSLQTLLADKFGISVGRFGADGRFGTDTARAVREFQGGHGCVVDGEAGPQTLGALWND